MDTDYLAIKAAAAAFLGMLGAVAGWKAIMLLLLAAAMVLDYISGSLAAMKDGTWCSRVAREGLYHKAGIVIGVLAALVADAAVGVAVPIIPIAGGLENPGIFLPLLLAWDILTEVGSVLENSAKMGAPVPAWFLRATANVRKQIDATGGAAADVIGSEPDEEAKP